MKTPSDPLDELLDRWGEPPDPPPHLAQEVRRRIAATPRPAAAAWWVRLDTAMARPSFAAAFVAACLLLGLFLAEARLSRLHAARSTQIAHDYLQLINPLIEGPATPPGATPP